MANDTEFSTRSMKQLIKANTSKRISDDAADELAKLVEEYGREIAQEARAFTEMKDRKTVRAEDVQQALGSRRKQVVREEQVMH